MRHRSLISTFGSTTEHNERLLGPPAMLRRWSVVGCKRWEYVELLTHLEVRNHDTHDSTGAFTKRT